VSASDHVDVRFVVTPFLPEHQPALGVSSLLSVLRHNDVTADLLYLNTEYLASCDRQVYFSLSRGIPAELLLGEMIFAPALWGDETPPWDEYEARLRLEFVRFARQMPLGLDEDEALAKQTGEWDAIVDDVKRLHDDSPEVVRAWADRVLEGSPKVVGFTTTFQQNIASLALARELRKRVPVGDLMLLFGGANCEADMGAALADNFPFVDHVVSGEGERIIVDLVRPALRGEPATLPRNVIGPMVQDMDTLPIPSFDEYFAAVEGTEIADEVNLAAESSRGCWWGMKSHCTFCGLNGTTMGYRSKSPQRFVDEIREIVRRHGNRYFMMADNILDLGYIKSFFPELIAAGDNFLMFYETKSNLRKGDLELMAAGGICKIQPGIESLSTPILALMGKGTTRLQNVQLLKWCEEFRVLLKWNVIYGFPLEPVEEYAAMAQIIPALVHLPPPAGSVKVRLDRFGPYWRSPQDYGIENVRRFWSYDFAYAGVPAAQRERLAYFFEYEYGDRRDPLEYSRPLIDATNDWCSAYERRATLEVVATEAGTRVIDTRGAEAREHPINDVERALLRVLDAAVGRRSLLLRLHKALGDDSFDQPSLDRLLADWLERAWLIEESGKLLSVVIDRGEYRRLRDLKVAMQMEALGLPFVVADGEPARDS